MSLLLTSLILATAHAVPVQTMHQGRLLDGDGVPMEGEIEVTFRLIDAETGGTIVWEETSTVTLTNGFYISMLGADEEENPLDTDALDQAPLWLELQLTEEPAMYPRSPITSVPYARIAGVAEEVDGGLVNASEVQVDGTVVIDEDGTWVGATPEVDWSDLSGVPLGLSDGLDADSLAEIVCEDSEIMRWMGTNWTCGEDADTWRSDEEIQAAVVALPMDFAGGSTIGGRTPRYTDDVTTVGWADVTGVPEGFADGTDDNSQLTESEVVDFVTDAAIDLATGTTVGGDDIATGAHTSTLGWSDLTGVPEGFADGTDDDSQLSESQVETYITNGAISLAAGTTIGGSSPLTGGALSGRIYINSSYTASYTSLHTASCDGSDLALGGGCEHTTSTSHYLVKSYPSAGAWHCSWGSTRFVQAYVICLDVD